MPSSVQWKQHMVSHTLLTTAVLAFDVLLPYAVDSKVLTTLVFAF